MTDMNAQIRSRAGRPTPPRVRIAPPGQSINPAEHQYVNAGPDVGWQEFPPGVRAPKDAMVVSTDRRVEDAELPMLDQKVQSFESFQARRQASPGGM